MQLIRWLILILGMLGAAPVLYGREAVQDRSAVAEVRIYGNTAFGKQALLESLSLKMGQPLPADWPKRSLDALAILYHEEGFFFFSLDSMAVREAGNKRGLSIRIWIHEGKRARVGTLISRSEEADSMRPIAFPELRTGKVFSAATLDQEIDQWLSFQQDAGFPLSSVTMDSIPVRFENGVPFIDLYLTASQGPRVRLDRVLVRGLTLTKPQVILRESRLQSGMVYSHRRMMAAREHIQRLGFLETGEPEITFAGDRATITFTVQEKNANTLDGMIGYIPSGQEGGKGVVTGRLQFLFRNLFGTGRFLEAFWEKKDRVSQAMRFGYEEPWLFGWPLAAGAGFEQIIRDTTYVDRQWQIVVRYRPWPVFSIDVKGGRKDILPDSAGSVVFGIPRSRSWLFRLGLDYDTFNEPLNPVRGVRYATELALGRKSNIGPDFLLDEGDWDPVVHTRMIRADVECAFPTFRRQVVYLGMHGAEVKTGDTFVALSEQIMFGGSETVRGYPEDAFRGTLAAWLNLEYRYLLGGRSRAFVFVDWGFYQRLEEREGWLRGSHVGFGFGLRLETRLGILGIDYGLGEGDSILRGKVHVRLANSF